MIPIHFNNNDGSSVEELILKLIEKLSYEFDKGYWGKDFIGFLKRIHEIKVAGTGFSLEKQESLIHDIKTNFSQLLVEICKNFEDRGIFFIIDDINGLSDNIEFTIGIKAFLNQYNSMNTTFQ